MPLNTAESPIALALPFEIKSHIMRECTFHSLTILARVHTEFNLCAEETLYKNIDVENTDRQSMRCLKMLDRTPHKARHVQSLRMMYINTYRRTSFYSDMVWFRDPKSLLLLASALKGMTNLVDLRLNRCLFKPDDDDDDEKAAFDAVSEVIRAGRFQLHILSCGVEFLSQDIITAQPSLETIGAYYTNDEGHEALYKTFDSINVKEAQRERAKYFVGYARPGGRMLFLPTRNSNPVPILMLIDCFATEWSSHRCCYYDVIRTGPERCELYVENDSDISDAVEIVKKLWTRYPDLVELCFYIYPLACEKTPLDELIKSTMMFCKLETLAIECVKNEQKVYPPIQGMDIVQPHSSIWSNPQWRIRKIEVNSVTYARR